VSERLTCRKGLAVVRPASAAVLMPVLRELQRCARSLLAAPPTTLPSILTKPQQQRPPIPPTAAAAAGAAAASQSPLAAQMAGHAREMALAARAASRKLQTMSTEERVAMLHRVADAIVANEAAILEANAKVGALRLHTGL